MEKHRDQIRMIKAMEQELALMPRKVIVFVPSSTDVLLGRGKPIQNHPGVGAAKPPMLIGSDLFLFE